MRNLRIINNLLLALLLIYPSSLIFGQNQQVLVLPHPGEMVSLSSAYKPMIVKGLRVHPDNPILFDFIMDTGDSKLDSKSIQLRQESEKLIKYFLAALAIPENDLWVNLSPYEKDRIISRELGQTAMGKDMLAQDYILKQLTASLVYPESRLGKEFWSRVYEKAKDTLGTSKLPINIFNKVWIVADKAKVYVHNNTALVVGCHLKVMLEEDYLAKYKHEKVITVSQGQGLPSQTIRDVIIPELEKEVNAGKNFSTLRQIFNSMILATWYKKSLKDAFLNKVYSNTSKIKGIELQDQSVKEKIYQQYLKAYKVGVFNFIKEDMGNDGNLVPRRYFSGGIIGAIPVQTVGVHDPDAAMAINAGPSGKWVDVRVKTPSINIGADQAMSNSNIPNFAYIRHPQLPVVEGQKVSIEAVMTNPEEAREYQAFLYSNRTGEWKEESNPLGMRLGKNFAYFSDNFVPDRDFEYTFVFKKKDGSQVWADVSRGNGHVWVNRKIEGRNIVSIGMEFRPLVMKGGQGDVNFELPLALSKKGGRVQVILPFFKKYASLYAQKGYTFTDTGIEFSIPFENHPKVLMKVKEIKISGITVYLLDAPEENDLFKEPYKTNDSEFYESILLSRGSVELMVALSKTQGKAPDIVMFADHHAALTPLYMRNLHPEFYAKTARVFVVHNASYQGRYNQDRLDELGLGDNDELKSLVMDGGELNFMGTAPAVAKLEHNRGWVAITVSPGYREEIVSNDVYRTNRLFADMGRAFIGISNGLDSDFFNPSKDEVLKSLRLPTFSKRNKIEEIISRKNKIKEYLQRTFSRATAHPEGGKVPDWESNKNTRVFGYLGEDKNRLTYSFVGRIAKQKQLDIFVDILEEIAEGKRKSLEFDAIIAGPGNGDDYETVERLMRLAKDHRLRDKGINLLVINGFVNELGNVISYGADSTLMLSSFEPGGIGQLKGMLVGAVPLAAETGGLKNTVFESHGYTFPVRYRGGDNDLEARRENAISLYQAMTRQVIDFIKHNDIFTSKRINGMRYDSGWGGPVQSYINEFARLRDELDAAQLAEKDPGGIDLNAQHMYMDIEGVDLVGTFDQSMIARFKRGDFRGVSPVILQIKSIQNPLSKSFSKN